MLDQRASPLWPRTTWKVCRSSRTGLWEWISRSVSPRVPTVEYARSDRSTAKSSHAARNSRLSLARCSASSRRQAGSILKNVNLTNVRSAILIRLAVAICALGLALPALAQADQPRVVLVLTDRGLDPEDLAEALPGVSPGGLSAGLSHVTAAQT